MADDDESTLLGPQADPATRGVEATALPPGTRVQEFQIEGVVGEGGFSVVYRARDTLLGRTIALKEYLPASLARREGPRQVHARTARQQETFDLGLRSFINEARLLASFEHPALVKVYRFWEENGTAYLVMPLYQGQTLRAWAARERDEPGTGSRIDEARVTEMLHPLLDALEAMHGKQCYHRDIAPDNILLLDDEDEGTGQRPNNRMRPVLLDFGAARRVIGDATQTFTVILKPGYAPIEQYAESAHARQGPWTDIYALCATLYHTVSGRVPQPSVSRVLHDDLKPARELELEAFSPAFLGLIDRGMAVRAEDRPQSVQELRGMLRAMAPLDGTLAFTPHGPGSSMQRAFDPEATVLVAKGSGAAASIHEEGASATARGHASAPKVFDTGTLPGAPASSVPDATRRRPALALVSVAVVAAAGLVTWALTREPMSSKPTDRSSAASLASVPATGAALSVPSSDGGAASAPVELGSPLAATPPRVARAEPFTVLGALQDIAAGADAGLAVSARAEKPRLTIGSDQLRFRVEASEAGFVYVYASGTSGSDFVLLFPNAADRNNRIAAGKPLRLPQKPLVSAGPPGVNHLLVVVSRSPRDFRSTGLVTKDKDIPEWNYEDAIHRWATRGTPEPGASEASLNPFIGKTACDARPTDCPQGYGAALFEVEEIEVTK